MFRVLIQMQRGAKVSNLTSEVEGSQGFQSYFSSRGEQRFRVLEGILALILQALMEPEFVDDGFNMNMHHNNSRTEAMAEVRVQSNRGKIVEERSIYNREWQRRRHQQLEYKRNVEEDEREKDQEMRDVDLHLMDEVSSRCAWL